MNRERAKELLPVIQAFAEGGKIQFRIANGIDEPWGDMPEDDRMSITFPCEDYEYRIKPEPREFWIIEGTLKGGGGIFTSEHQAEEWCNDHGLNYSAKIHVIEVLD